jgi:hypothetical protein
MQLLILTRNRIAALAKRYKVFHLHFITTFLFRRK